MNTKKFLVFVSLFLLFGNASSSPKDDVLRLIDKSKLTTVKFSDGSKTWKNGTTVYKLDDNKAIIVNAKQLALDTDGASAEIRACDATSQAKTALSDSHGNPTDANSIPYFVLPVVSCHRENNKTICTSTNSPSKQLGLKLGDLAVVISGDKLAYAIAADAGPANKFGEGSVQLHRELGHETVGKIARHPKCAIDESMASEVLIVVFPNSNRKWLPKEDISKKGAELWDALIKSEIQN
ncbi:MAG: glycoside hydrolase family 75 protein [Methylococcaceae bacterium]